MFRRVRLVEWPCTEIPGQNCRGYEILGDFKFKNRRGNLWTVIDSHRSRRIICWVSLSWNSSNPSMITRYERCGRVDKHRNASTIRVCSCMTIDFVWSVGSNSIMRLTCWRSPGTFRASWYAIVENKKWPWSRPCFPLEKKKLPPKFWSDSDGLHRSSAIAWRIAVLPAPAGP